MVQTFFSKLFKTLLALSNFCETRVSMPINRSIIIESLSGKNKMTLPHRCRLFQGVTTLGRFTGWMQLKYHWQFAVFDAMFHEHHQ